MKHYLKILCLFIPVIACQKNEGEKYIEYKNIQSINVVETIELTKVEEGKFLNPKLTATGKKAVFTTENYTGLWYYDFETKVINQLNPSIGAGINFDVSKTEDKVYFRLQSTSAKGMTKNFSIAEQDIDSKSITILFTSKNFISAPHSLPDGNIAFLSGQVIKVLNPSLKEFIKDYNSENIIAFADGDEIKFKVNGKDHSFKPEDGNKVLWTEVTAKNDKIYFVSTENGTGAYIMESKQIKWFGDFRYLKCAPNSNLIVYSFYENYNYDLCVSGDDGLKKFNISNSADENEIFPYWSGEGEQIIYNTADGVIKLVKLKINKGSNV